MPSNNSSKTIGMDTFHHKLFFSIIVWYTRSNHTNIYSQLILMFSGFFCHNISKTQLGNQVQCPFTILNIKSWHYPLTMQHFYIGLSISISGMCSVLQKKKKESNLRNRKTLSFHGLKILLKCCLTCGAQRHLKL